MDELKKKFPGREKQIDQLDYATSQSLQILNHTPQSLFIYGPPSTGKTTVITEFFKHNGAYVNCVECFTPRLLFEHSLDRLIKHKPTFTNGYTTSRKIDNVQQFVKAVQENVSAITRTKYLILDKAERIRDMPGTILPVLLRLSELTERNICVVLISNIVFEKFRVKGGGVDPYLIRFPDYTREDTLRILQLDFKPTTIDSIIELNNEFYEGFLEVIYSIFCHNCKDLNELRYFSSLLFPIYIKPLQEGLVERHERAKLFKYAQPYFAEATEQLYLREISSAEWNKKQKKLANDVSVSLELPYYTRFLLIAAYLASYNPPRFDIRYFSKTASEERKKKRGGGTRKTTDKLGGKMRQQLLGPKAFPVERMLAIFYSIIDDDTLEDTVDIQLQITSLVTLRLLVRTTSMDRLDGAKYKCNVNFEFVRAVAKSVKFEIDKYLYDFC
ncbi:origin recognition complex, subunit 5 [Cokeromyces recurvatus]|uniref:origin recognition complex, subunit 5 n=1 Tax=Cokeromyces recurvatus TaxID=90255 RepID=UPI0022200482|nr:origin recognition complex, subunit 5 [Cokeromyces recurvatus]KAI7904142.1 origin recognition complex, subunit 5 [Cokeromyces recurvatus]